MKTQEEIEQLATKHYKSNGSGGGQYTEGLQDGLRTGYVDGYTQCQEDIYKELEKLKEAIRKNTWYDEDGFPQVGLYGIDNKLLNKQD